MALAAPCDGPGAEAETLDAAQVALNVAPTHWNAVREELRPRVEKATTMAEARDAVMHKMIDRFQQSHSACCPARSSVRSSPADGTKPATAGARPA
ncbi:MAG: hypothetical protein U0800_25565 [Isosphaeraceae bacterium]